jgi:hypothetical protein
MENDENDEKNENQRNIDRIQNKDFLIVSSRDITRDELELLRTYGNVLEYDDCHNNIPINTLITKFKPHYLLFDVRKKNHRMILTKEFRDQYHILALISWYEYLEDFIEDIDAVKVIKDFPTREASREIFDLHLFQPKIREPNICKSFFQCVRQFQSLYRVSCTKLRGCVCQQILICAGAPPPIVYAANVIL